jgi:DNA-directed RNA polymerase specialized sigma subunit
VVREVMARTGINRTTAQRMTASLRAEMRERQQSMARGLLHQGKSKAEVAHRVGLSPSRISALFKGNTYNIRSRLLDTTN